MNSLKIINQNGQLVTDSREVANMIGKDHAHLMRDIKGYIEILGKSNFGLSDFFISSSYKSNQNKDLPCYLITKKGCDMVANKMTGEKGVLFTATYVTEFEKMKKQLEHPACLEDVMIQSLQEMKNLRLQINENKQEIQSMRDVITLNPTQWRKDTTVLINKMALIAGGYDHIKAIREESYKLLNERFGVDVHTRITNKRRRMADEGVCKSIRDKLTVLDVIQDDKKLIEGYVAIIKEMSIKYKAA